MDGGYDDIASTRVDETLELLRPVFVGVGPLSEELHKPIGAEREEAEEGELTEQLARIPDLTKTLREAAPEVQRQVFEAFELQIHYDKAERKLEISATVSEAVANAFEKQKALPKEGSLVVLREVAGARFVSRYDAARIREQTELPPSAAP